MTAAPAPAAAALPPPPRPVVPPPSRPAPSTVPAQAPPVVAADLPAAALVPAQRGRPATPASESGGVPAVGRLGLFSHRPAGYSSAGWWLMAGIGRDWRATVAALVGGWFGLPVAIALAVAGAVVGGIVGLVGGAAVAGEALEDVPVVGEVLVQFSTLGGGGLGALGGIVLGVLGVLGGFAGGLLAPWLVDYLDDPVVTLIVVLLNIVLGLAVGVLYVVYGTVLEPWRLRLGGARRMSRREEEFLLPIMHECGQRMGLANLPRLLIDDGRLPNAFAYTRHIVVQRGLLVEFEYDREAVAGVLSHELAHWHNADGVAGLFVRGVALPLYVAHRAATLVLQVFDNSIVRFLAISVAWPALTSVRYFIVPLQSASARRAEYRADQGAVLAGHRDGLRLVLGRLRRSVDGSRNGWDEAICASHPPTELRLEALEREGVDYPLVPVRR
ncbi:M48 family metalloprotease [Phytohabitans flavus]|uniref:M48 family metalloprotease n=1 Tax=Phytohabitans flavus TaxID=1076124 RepID=UPI0031EC49DB